MDRGPGGYAGSHALSPFGLGTGKSQIRAWSRSGGILHPKELERRIFQLTNEGRRKNGLPSLDWDNSLAVNAREKSDDMLTNNYFSHTSPDGKTLKDRFQDEKPGFIRNISRVGENIYMGPDWIFPPTLRLRPASSSMAG